MLPPDKETLYLLILSLSKEERVYLSNFFKEGKSHGTYLTIFRYYSRKKAQQRPSRIGHLSGNALAKAKFHVTQKIIEYLKGQVGLNGDILDEEFKEAKVYQVKGLLSKSFQVMTKSLNRAISKESYYYGEIIFETLTSIFIQLKDLNKEPPNFDGIKKRVYKLRASRNEFELYNSMYIDRLKPIIDHNALTGVVLKSDLSVLLRSIQNLPKPDSSLKAMTMRDYIESYCLRMLGDYKGAASRMERVKINFRNAAWLRNELNLIFPFILIQMVVDYAEQNDKIQISSLLKELKTMAKEDKEVFLWRYLFALLVASETFKDEKFLKIADTIYLEEADVLLHSMRTSDFMGISFFLLKCNVIFNRITKLPLILKGFSQVSGKDQNFEIKIYTRIYELIFAWEDRDFEAMERVILSINRFIRKSNRQGDFIQAIELVKAFEVLSKGNVLNLETYYKLTLKSIEGLPGSVLQESKYFDGAAYFKAKIEALAHSANQHSA